MIDWLLNGEPERVFVSTPDAVLTYGDLMARLPVRHSGVVTVVHPGNTVASVADVFSAMWTGPLVLSDGRGWFGYQLASNVLTVLTTSGTTGEPKRVPLSHDNWKAAVRASASHLEHSADDQWLVAMPVHRVGGLAVLMRSAFVGARVRLLPSFDTAAFADELGDGTTMASVVPTMLRRVLDHDSRRYRGLRAVLVGGGPIPPGLLEEAADRGIPVLPTYGMTETCAQVATLKPGAPLAYKADLLPGVDARIEPDGRIALRGPQVFNGYLGQEPRAADAWFITGDLGSLDGGALRIEGRADSIIVTGGENVDPSGVERAVRAHPGVVAAMVVGVPSSEWGSEVVCLYVGDVASASLDEWVRAQGDLERFEIPKRWVEVSAIPTTELGQPDRGGARSIAEAAHPD